MREESAMVKCNVAAAFLISSPHKQYDHRLLHGGFSNRPLLITVVPPLSCAPTYRPRPADQHDIGEFIDDVNIQRFIF